MKFRKKPVVIEAVQYVAENVDELVAFLPPGTVFSSATEGPDLVLISTLEGTMAGAPGDWIIKGVHGEFYPCKPDIFAATYEPVCDPTWGPPSVGADVQGGDTTCSHINTAKNPDGSEFGEGFYWVCADCGAKGWYD